MAGLGLFPEELEELVAAYPSTNVEKTVCYRCVALSQAARTPHNKNIWRGLTFA